MANLYEYIVEGVGSFPIDMLRYDNSWPATEEDARRIAKRLDHSVQDETKPIIMLRSFRDPCVERWKSFMWRVKSVKAHRI